MSINKTKTADDTETTIKVESPNGTGKREYVEPALLVYGTVRGLTATGTGLEMEAGQSSNNPQKKP
ncbi:MAG: hypothetical protein IPM55_21050 [Acidobacteria bacterium]|nr:hypothetical protein [Acidobacteriota bacterium]